MKRPQAERSAWGLFSEKRGQSLTSSNRHGGRPDCHRRGLRVRVPLREAPLWPLPNDHDMAR